MESESRLCCNTKFMESCDFSAHSCDGQNNFMLLTAKLFYLLEVFWKRLDVMFVIYVYKIIFRTFDSLKIDCFPGFKHVNDIH